MADQRFDSTGVHAGSSPLCVVGLCAWLKGDLSLLHKLHFLFGVFSGQLGIRVQCKLPSCVSALAFLEF